MATWTVASKGHSSARAAVQKRQSSAPYVFRNSRVGSAAAPRPVAVAAAATPSGSLLPRYLAGQDQRWWGWPPWHSHGFERAGAPRVRLLGQEVVEGELHLPKEMEGAGGGGR